MSNPPQWTPPPGWQPGQPPPKKKHTVRNIVFGALGALTLIIVIVAVASNSGGSSKSATPGPSSSAASAPSATTSPSPQSVQASGSHPATADVVISTCAPTDFGTVGAKVVVTNYSSKTSNYLITVAMTSSDGHTQIDTGDATVNNLGPGQSTSPQDADGSNVPPTAGYVCKVASVTRYASDS